MTDKNNIFIYILPRQVHTLENYFLMRMSFLMLGTRENRKDQEKKRNLIPLIKLLGNFSQVIFSQKIMENAIFKNAVSFEWVLSFIYHH